MRKFIIRAGNGSMKESGYVIIDGGSTVMEKETPFTAHDRAVELLVEGATLSEASAQVEEEFGCECDIWEDFADM